MGKVAKSKSPDTSRSRLVEQFLYYDHQAYERLTHLATGAGVTPDQLLNHSHFLQADVYERLTHMATQAGAAPGQFLTQANRNCRQFLSDEGGCRSRLGVDPGEGYCRKTAGKPPSKTAGKTAGKPLWKTGRKTAGKLSAKPLENPGKLAENGWKTGRETTLENCRKTAVEAAGKRLETVGKTAVDRENGWKTAGRPLAGKTADHWKTGKLPG